MTSTRSQSWESVDPDIREHVESAVEAVAAHADLTGAYLHGSLAMGCYRRAHSDLDLLFVVAAPLPVDTRRALAREFVALSDTRPTPGDIEMSVVLEREAREFSHPLPFELHVSADWVEAIRRGDVDFAPTRRDPDLTAHIAVVRARGVALVGIPPAELFDPPPWRDYVAAVEGDFDWIIDEGGIHESPIYGVLNLCRTLQLRAHPGTVASKEEGGVWGSKHLPEAHRPLVEQALFLYRGQSDRAEWDAAALDALRDWAKEQPR